MDDIEHQHDICETPVRNYHDTVVQHRVLLPESSTSFVVVKGLVQQMLTDDFEERCAEHSKWHPRDPNCTLAEHRQQETYEGYKHCMLSTMCLSDMT